MADWIPIERWAECARLERPGIVFELRNAEGLTLLTPCVMPLPAVPFDWTSPAVSFRPVAEEPARHSGPIPKPAQGNP